MHFLRLTILLLIFVVGCENSTQPEPIDSAKKREPQAEKTESSPVSLPPKYKPVIVKVENLIESGSTAATFSPLKSSSIKVKHGSSIGSADAVSKLNWEYLRTDEKGDHYRFERSFALDKTHQTMTTKEVIYQGQELILFEDDDQRISMFPAKVEASK